MYESDAKLIAATICNFQAENQRLRDKIDKIEEIVASWNNDASNSFGDMCKINGILNEQLKHI